MSEIIECPICHKFTCEREYDGDKINYICNSCGYMSYSELTKDAYDKISTNLPKIVQVLHKVVDESNSVWIPFYSNIDKVGAIFPEGNENNWKWAVVLSVPIHIYERLKYPMLDKPGLYYESKLDINTAVRFDNTDFKSAFEYFTKISEQ